MRRHWLKQIGAPFILSHKEQSLSYRLINNELFGETEQFQHLFLIRYFSFITYEIKPQNRQRHPLLQKAECDRKKCRKCGLHVLCGDIIYALTIHSNNTDMRIIYDNLLFPWFLLSIGDVDSNEISERTLNKYKQQLLEAFLSSYFLQMETINC